MRKIEQQMNRAIVNRNNWSNSNTQVNYNSNTDCSAVYLHGNQIATVDHNTQAVKLSSCGWQSVTTKSRLNAILQGLIAGASVYQKQFNWFLNYNNVTHNFNDGMILSNGEVV
jgi:hypothetical protein